MPIFYRPRSAWLGDVIPYCWGGRFHLFYLHDQRQGGSAIGTVPWFHLSTMDLVTFADHGVAIPAGTSADADPIVGTGSVVESEGRFHIFYTGYNPWRTAEGLSGQVVLHATSDDLNIWSKDRAFDPVEPDGRYYEQDDWRDPFVFWNPEVSEWWMLLAARVRHGPADRRGCVALATSSDLASWAIQPPVWTPYVSTMLECPDLFFEGGRWHLLFSTSCDRIGTRHGVAPHPIGPWREVGDGAIDGPRLYAAKSQSDGCHRYAFGWMPTLADDHDSGDWQWGGDLVIHQLSCRDDGSLRVTPPAELLGLFDTPLDVRLEPRLGVWSQEAQVVRAEAGGFAWCRLGDMPATCLLEATLESADCVDVGLALRADANLDSSYMLRIEPIRRRVVFDRRPHMASNPFAPGASGARAMASSPDFLIERPLEHHPGEPLQIRVIADGSALVVYVGDVALSTRGYDLRGGGWGLFATGGSARFSGVGSAGIGRQQDH